MTSGARRRTLERWHEAECAPDDESPQASEVNQVVLAGSMSALRTMTELASRLERSGVKAVVPVADDDPSAWSIEAIDAMKRRASLDHISHIRDSKTMALLVANLDRADNPNYIGPNTFAEIAIAFADQRPIYLLQGIPVQYEDELRAWGVHCLFGDLDRMLREVAPSGESHTPPSTGRDNKHPLTQERVS